MALRKVGDWITSYLEYVNDTEPPLNYHVWTAISVIASTLQRKVWLVQGHESIYPNMYIVLVGASGRCRKGTAIGIGAHLMGSIKEVKLSSESTTREALIKRMKGALTTVADPLTPHIIKTHCSMTIVSEELSVFLRQNDINFLSNLTNWYDSRDVWTYETKHGGAETVEGLCVNLLGGTAPDWLESMLPKEAVGGGFTSRIIFVTEERKRKTVVAPKMNDKKRDNLIADLEQIVQLVGQYIMSPEAETMYKNWYEEQDVLAKDGKFAVSDNRFTGYCERRPTHIKKLSMIVNASHTNDKIITADDFQRARNYLETAEKQMHKTFGGFGENKFGHQTESVIRFLSNHKGKIARREIMKMFYRDIDPDTMNIVQRTLEEMGFITVSLQTEGKDAGQTFYEVKK